ncbi:hypothetical protein [Streptomyces chilikensis]|uniref:hypothetical protein n=1 Tax=Streptomyces chilikensis TaxID=1194079 RepID=UPI000ADC3E77|nr:hypothetical protein [Streptomyces chilikensis]
MTERTDELRPLRRAVLLVVIAGAVLALGVVGIAWGFHQMPGNSCGGRYGVPCPSGSSPAILVGSLLAFTGWVCAAYHVPPLSRHRHGKVLVAAMLVLAGLVVAWPAWQVYGLLG